MPDNSDNKNQAKNAAKSYARFKTRKVRAILALVLVAVLLFTALVSSFASLIMMLIASEDTNPNEEFQQTYLYVKVLDSDGKPVSGYTITLTQMKGPDGKGSDGKSDTEMVNNPVSGAISEMSKTKAITYTLGPTDKNGIAKIPYNVAGMIAGFSYPAPAEFKPDGSGRPTAKIVATYHRGYTFYSQPRRSNYLKGNTLAFAHMSNKGDQSAKPHGSDTWHIFARQMAYNPKTGRHYSDNGEKKFPYDTYCYAADNRPGSADYGVGIVEDCGSSIVGNHAELDAYAPYTKYFGDGKEGNQSAFPWEKAIGIPQGDARNGTVYVLGDSLKDSQKRGAAIRKQINRGDGQPWPGTQAAVPGTKGTTTKDKSPTTASSNTSETYSIDGHDSDNKRKVGGTGLLLLDMSKVHGASEENPVTITGGIKTRITMHFWIAIESEGADTGNIPNDVKSPQYCEGPRGCYIMHTCGNAGVSIYHGINGCGHDGDEPLFKGSALPDCTSWVWGRYYDVHHKKLSSVYGSPKHMPSTLSDIPSGSYVVWSGHVAFVEKSDNSGITISESGKTYYQQNKGKSSHPWYQTRHFTSLSELKAHSKGSFQGVVN